MSDRQITSRTMWFSLLPMIFYAVVGPYVIFRLASPHMSTVNALLLAAAPPALMNIVDLVRQRRLNLIGSLALVGILIKLISAALVKDVRLVLVSDSLMLGVYGILVLGSLLLGKPLLLTLATSALAGMPSAERQQMEQRWLAKGRAKFTFLTALWGAGLLLVLLVNTILVYTLSVPQFLLISPIVQYGTIGSLIGGHQIVLLVQRLRKRPLQPVQEQG
jgi:hypothetical protein